MITIPKGYITYSEYHSIHSIKSASLHDKYYSFPMKQSILSSLYKYIKLCLWRIKYEISFQNKIKGRTSWW
jgi:transcriptional antiterminator